MDLVKTGYEDIIKAVASGLLVLICRSDPLIAHDDRGILFPPIVEISAGGTYLSLPLVISDDGKVRFLEPDSP